MTASVAESSLAALAMFPLPDTVLFPGTALPLHVFEPRYRTMIADTLAGDGLLAIARLRPGYESDYDERPSVFDVVGLGRIVAHDELEDGRYNMLVQGLGRARILRELAPDRAYRRVQVELLDDESTPRLDELIATHAQLVALCKRIAGALGEQGEQLSELVSTIESPSRCADIVAAALVGDADERQRLLATVDPVERLEHAVGCVAALARQVAGDDSGMLQ